MTVYVDNARIPARIGRVSARWSHATPLIADDRSGPPNGTEDAR
jgi:hypothetical protein